MLKVVKKQKVMRERGIDEKLYKVDGYIGGSIYHFLGIEPEGLTGDEDMYELTEGSPALLERIVLTAIVSYHQRQLTESERNMVGIITFERFPDLHSVFDFVIEMTELPKEPVIGEIKKFNPKKDD